MLKIQLLLLVADLVANWKEFLNIGVLNRDHCTELHFCACGNTFLLQGVLKYEVYSGIKLRYRYMWACSLQ